MTGIARDLWGDILRRVREVVKPHQFQTWFENLRFKGIDGRNLQIASPNRFIKEWVEQHYLELLTAAASDALGFRPEIEVVIEEEASAPPDPLPPAPSPPPRPVEATAPRVHTLDGSNGNQPTITLNRNYTFENFVIGPCNRLSHAAALAVVENPAQTYNPLFLHGAVGLGKSHLLQAICHSLLQRGADMRILYLSCESFVNQFISAIQHNDLEAFRNKFRQMDVLVIDDIHFLANKERTQEEFFHTFNVLYNAQKQIIISSDASPKEIPKLEERLVSRFKWGLVARLDLPTFETRVAILQRKAAQRGRPLSDDVAHFIASQLETNVRELEGAVVKVMGYASLANRDVDIPLVREALSDTLESGQKSISIEQVKDAVVDHFSVKLSDLQSKRRSKSISFPRQIAMYLARELTDYSLEEVGGYFGGRDHTTVMYATEKIQSLVKEDPRLMATLESLTREIKKASQ